LFYVIQVSYAYILFQQWILLGFVLYLILCMQSPNHIYTLLLITNFIIFVIVWNFSVFKFYNEHIRNGVYYCYPQVPLTFKKMPACCL
jgi:hypothetical protein